MSDMHINGLDLKLAPALEALLRRRNVTLAAKDLGLSQPAMSRILARLRDIQGDPLLVRGPGGYLLTPRAAALQPRLAEAMSRLYQVFHPPVFDPGQQRRVIRLAGADAHTILLAPGIAARLAAEAPGVTLRIESYGPTTAERVLAGDLDMVFALTNTPLAPGAHSEAVSDDRLALVMRRGHPAAHRPWTVADYVVWPSVAVALIGDGQSDLDAKLAGAGVRRKIVLVTPHFTAALAVVAGTDMVTTLSEGLARRFQGAFDLHIQAPPFDDNRLRMTLVTSHVRAADPFFVWFRGLTRDVAASIGLGVKEGEGA